MPRPQGLRRCARRVEELALTVAFLLAGHWFSTVSPVSLRRSLHTTKPRNVRYLPRLLQGPDSGRWGRRQVHTVFDTAVRASRGNLPVPEKNLGDERFPAHDPSQDLGRPFAPPETNMEDIPIEEVNKFPVPDIHEPSLEKPWDGWGEDDLQDVIDAQNRVDDLDRERHQKICESIKMSPLQEKYQKKYREIFDEALAYGMTDEVFRDIDSEFPGMEMYLDHAFEDYSNPWHLLDFLPESPEDRQDNLDRLTERLMPTEREFVKFRMDENLGYIIELSTPDGGYLEVHAHGASIQSWVPVNGTEMLWRPDEYEYTRKEAYPGGIQLKFPIHNEDNPFMDPGGFTSNMEWKITGGSVWGEGSPEWTLTESVCPTVELTLETQEDTHLMWGEQNKFKIVYTITLMRKKIRTEVRIFNEGSRVWEFTGGLSAHLRIDNAKVLYDIDSSTRI
mmetsp:Transcript_4385/g.10283  ORF Transcript_4385/g.10283 Transcript_4385/m.10283 type:complete len:448 (-) Transcript_4385:574-1917(-)